MKIKTFVSFVIAMVLPLASLYGWDNLSSYYFRYWLFGEQHLTKYAITTLWATGYTYGLLTVIPIIYVMVWGLKSSKQ